MCTCDRNRPYCDGFLVTAQLLSVAAFGLMVRNYLDGSPGFLQRWTQSLAVEMGYIPSFYWIDMAFVTVAFLLLQVACCYNLRKGGLITAGIFALVGPIFTLVFCIKLIQFSNAEESACKARCDANNASAGDEDNPFADFTSTFCYSVCEISGKLNSEIVKWFLIPTVVWLLAAPFVFAFACSKRYAAAWAKIEGTDDDDDDDENENKDATGPENATVLAGQISQESEPPMASVAIEGASEDGDDPEAGGRERKSSRKKHRSKHRSKDGEDRKHRRKHRSRDGDDREDREHRRKHRSRDSEDSGHRRKHRSRSGKGKSRSRSTNSDVGMA